MKAERESVGIAIPFVAGASIVTFTLQSMAFGRAEVMSSVCMGLLCLCAALCCGFNCGLIGGKRQGEKGRLRNIGGIGQETQNVQGETAQPYLGMPLWKGRGLIWTMFLLLGGFTGAVSFIPGLSLEEGQGAGFFGHCASALKNAIDAIPFHSSDCNALLKALLTGDRSGLSGELRAAFRSSGASHFLALSGMHLGIIYLMVSKALSLTGRSPAARGVKSILIIVATGFFTVMTGASASIVRAFLFIFLREVAMLLHRKIDGVTLICDALLIQVAFCPWVVSSVSFQLSYLAMAGIILLYPLLHGLWKQEGEESGAENILIKPMRKLWDMISVSVACQVFTAPLAWHYFRTFPRYFLITNLFCIPLTTGVMFMGIASVVATTCGTGSGWLVSGCEWIMNAMIFTLKTIAGM